MPSAKPIAAASARRRRKPAPGLESPLFMASVAKCFQVLEALNRPADAAKEYTTFLAIAAKSDMRRDAAEAKMASLSKSTSRTNPLDP